MYFVEGKENNIIFRKKTLSLLERNIKNKKT
jgi:hypothetical protein